jgi:hypothetical protein
MVEVQTNYKHKKLEVSTVTFQKKTNKSYMEIEEINKLRMINITRASTLVELF